MEGPAGGRPCMSGHVWAATGVLQLVRELVALVRFSDLSGPFSVAGERGACPACRCECSVGDACAPLERVLLRAIERPGASSGLGWWTLVAVLLLGILIGGGLVLCLRSLLGLTSWAFSRGERPVKAARVATPSTLGDGSRAAEPRHP